MQAPQTNHDEKTVSIGGGPIRDPEGADYCSFKMKPDDLFGGTI